MHIVNFADNFVFEIIAHPNSQNMQKFIRGGIYYVHNAGCGQQNVFFQQRNYEYFEEKINRHIQPYAEVITYKLMPNEIHLMIQVKHEHLYIPHCNRERTLAESIGLALRSYAQAINNQEKRKGVLWQGPTKYLLCGMEELLEDIDQQPHSMAFKIDEEHYNLASAHSIRNLLNLKQSKKKDAWTIFREAVRKRLSHWRIFMFSLIYSFISIQALAEVEFETPEREEPLIEYGSILKQFGQIQNSETIIFEKAALQIEEKLSIWQRVGECGTNYLCLLTILKDIFFCSFTLQINLQSHGFT